MNFKTLFIRRPKSKNENSPAATSAVTEQIQSPKVSNTMNYVNMFRDTDLLDGGDNFRCLHFPSAGQADPINRSSYPMLFVLQGELTMRFKYNSCRVTRGNLIVVDAKAMTECCAAQDTVVLVYRPPRRLAMLFSHCSWAFDAQFSDIVPILPLLGEWIDRLLTEHMQGKVWVGEEAYEQRKALARIMVQEYPRRELGELYAAFSACVLGACKQCRQTAVDVQ